MFNRQNISKSTTEHQLIFWRRFFLAALILLLIPLAIISFYSHGMSDDFVWSTHQYRALQNGEGLIGFLKGCHEETHWNYYEHHGEFTAILLGVLNPLSFGDEWYWITGFVTIGCLLLCVFAFWRLVTDGSREERVMADIAACITSIILIELLPRAIDMFYWFDGSVNYLPFYGMLMVIAALHIRLCREGRLPIRAMIVLCILLYFSVGGNTVTMVVNVCAILGIGIAIAILFGKNPGERNERYQHLWRYWWISMLAMAAGLLTALLAPGNQARFEDEGGSMLDSVFEVITRTIDYAAAAVCNQTGMLMFMLLALLIPILWIWSQRIIVCEEGSGRRSVFSLPAFLVVAYAFFLQCAGYAPTIWVYGTEGAPRMEDVRFFYLVFWLILIEFYFVGKVALLTRGHLASSVAERSIADHVPNVSSDSRNDGMSAPAITRFLAADLAMILIFGMAYYILPSTNRDKLTSVSATISLLTGEAQRYDEQVKAQNAILLDPSTKGQDVTVMAVSDHPKTIYAGGLEMQGDPTCWINQAVAAYYDKASVTLISANETADEAADESAKEDGS